MTLAGIYLSGPFRDDMIIRIYLESTPDVAVASGRWYQDQILAYIDRKVRRFMIDYETRRVDITVEGNISL